MNGAARRRSRPRLSPAALASLPDVLVRRRLIEALEHCAPRERLLLALLLVERLSLAEAAAALHVPEVSVARRYRALLAELARAYHGLGSRRAAHAATAVARLRRAA